MTATLIFSQSLPKSIGLGWGIDLMPRFISIDKAPGVVTKANSSSYKEWDDCFRHNRAVGLAMETIFAQVHSKC